MMVHPLYMFLLDVSPSHVQMLSSPLVSSYKCPDVPLLGIVFASFYLFIQEPVVSQFHIDVSVWKFEGVLSYQSS